MPRQIRSVTLLELLIAIALISVIVIGFSSIDLFSRYHVISSDRRAKLQNEVSVGLDHMTKQIGRAIGDFNNPAIKAYSDNKGIRVRIDDNSANGKIDAGDHWIAYRHENIGSPATDSEIRYYPNADNTETPAGISESIARKIVISTPTFYGLEFSLPFDVLGRLTENFINITLTACYDPDGSPNACGTLDNPTVTMLTRIKMPSVSTN